MILAADPGLTGALATYDGEALEVIDMPTYTATRNGRDRRILSESSLLELMTTHRMLGAETFVLEQVGGRPGQSAPAAFTFGYGVGVLIGFATLLGYQLERVAPATWKSALKVPADKRAARARASELLPGYGHLWGLQKHDGRAEAALLAYWGWLTRGRAM